MFRKLIKHINNRSLLTTVYHKVLSYYLKTCLRLFPKHDIPIKYFYIINNKAIFNYTFDFAEIGEVEINKNCNLNCLMCKSWDSRRENIYMEYNIFRKALDETKKLRANRVNIYTIGEPLLNPYLKNYLEILRSYNMKAGFSTNGLLLHKNNNIDLLFSYSDVINNACIRFSVDGASKEVYEKIRTPGNFERLITNLKLFNDANQDKIFTIKFDSIISTDNKNEIAKYYSTFSEYTDMSNIHVNLMNGLAPDNTYFFEANVLPQYIIKNIPCKEQIFNNMLHILNNGDVTVCCRDYHGDLIIGNIAESTTFELINNEKILALRKAHLNRSVAAGSLCNNCYVIDERVIGLFAIFTENLIHKHKNSWDEEMVQAKFDQFFDVFSEKIPCKKDFIKLCE